MICRHNESGQCIYCGRAAPSLPFFRNCPVLLNGKHPADVIVELPFNNGGPGTELKAMLSKVGITSSPTCRCNARVAHMDQQGCDWCEANIDEIVGWLRESAAERGLPFLDVAARLLVRRAISNARRKSALTK